MIAAYDDEYLYLAYKDVDHKWQIKSPQKLGIKVISDIQSTIDKFPLKEDGNDQKKNLFNLFRNNALQLSDNLILLSSWVSEGSKIYSQLNILRLNEKYKINQQWEKKILIDDLDNFSYIFNNFEYGTGIGGGYKENLELGYKAVDGKFKIYIKRSIDTTFKEMYREDLENALSNSIFLLNPFNYQGVFRLDEVRFYDKKLVFNGQNDWKVIDVKPSNSILLGDYFVLSQENSKSPFKLYRQGKDKKIEGSALLDLEVNNVGDIQNRYPIYLSYQKNSRPLSEEEKEKENLGDINKIEFINNGKDISESYKLPSEENLSFYTNNQFLITQRDGDLILRSALGSAPNSVIHQMMIIFDGEKKRIIGYEYDTSSLKVSSNIIYYEKTSLIPGNNKNSFGWIEEYKDHENNSGETKVFNGNEDLIQILKPKKDVQSEKDGCNKDDPCHALYSTSTLFDSSGELEVAAFFPYEIKDEEIGYYGFESYEENKIGQTDSSGKKWIFNSDNVVKRDFSLTGKSFLRLDEHSPSIKGSFQPSNQYLKYIASCWIRSDKITSADTFSTHLRVSFQDENGTEIITLIGQVKFQLEEWAYLEATVDIPYAKAMYEEINKSSKSGDLKLKAIVTVNAGKDEIVDIDHIRFLPLNGNVQANVYDEETGLVTEIIETSGLVKKYVYDKYQKQVATLNEHGQVDNLTTYSRSLDKKKSRTNISPSSGFYERFSPFSFQERWKKLSGSDCITTSSGTLQHTSDTISKLQFNSDYLSSSVGIRFDLTLQSEESSIKINSLHFIRLNDEVFLVNSDIRLPIPINCEILIVSLDEKLFVWIEGSPSIDIKGNLKTIEIEPL